MENKKLTKQSSGLPSRPLIGSAAAPRRNAKRKTPDECATLILTDIGIFGTPFEYERRKKYIADLIREAIQSEREDCAMIATNFYNVDNPPPTMAQEVTALDIALAIDLH